MVYVPPAEEHWAPPFGSEWVEPPPAPVPPHLWYAALHERSRGTTVLQLGTRAPSPYGQSGYLDRRFYRDYTTIVEGRHVVRAILDVGPITFDFYGGWATMTMFVFVSGAILKTAAARKPLAPSRIITLDVPVNPPCLERIRVQVGASVEFHDVQRAYLELIVRSTTVKLLRPGGESCFPECENPPRTYFPPGP